MQSVYEKQENEGLSMLCPCGEKTPTGHSLQLITGGKKTFQKLGAGELNSMGTNDPSELN